MKHTAKLHTLTAILLFISIGAFSQTDTTSNKYITIGLDYYEENIFMNQNFEWFDYPLIGNQGGVVSMAFFYKNKKKYSDYLVFDIGFSNHPQQYYKLFTNLQSGTRLNIKHGFFADILGGISFHNSWTKNSFFTEPVNKETENILKWGDQKLYFQGSFIVGKKIAQDKISILLKTDFFVSYPFAFDNYINAVRLGISYNLTGKI